MVLDSLADAGYRLLGALVVSRRAWVGATAFCIALGSVQLLQLAAAEPTALNWLAALAVPALVAGAAAALFRLPPGVAFRATSPVARESPVRTARCRASAYFDGRRGTRWRLLARSSLAFDSTGALHVVSPPPIRAAPDQARAAFPTRAQPSTEQLRNGDLPRYPEWVYQPQALVGGPSRLVYQSADDYTRAVAHLWIARERLVDVRPGSQYGGWRRWPALRLEYCGATGTVSLAYLAFEQATARDWALAELVGRRQPDRVSASASSAP